MRSVFLCILTMLLVLNAQFLWAAAGTQKNSDGLKQNFVVPDAPAFLLLGVSGDSNSASSTTILRPATVREVVVDASDFVSNGSFVVPSSFAAEIAPFLIANNALNRNFPSFLEHLRISIGTHRPTAGSNATQLAVGLRLTFFNDADLRNDSVLQSKLDSLNNMVVAQVIQGGRPTDANRGVISTSSADIQAKQQEIAKHIEAMQDTSWNKNCLEFALAGRGSSPDSLGKDLRFDNLSAWLTWAYRTGKNSQLFLGATFSSTKNLQTDTAFTTVLNIGTRFYLGANYYKGFVMAEAQVKKGDNRLSTGIGVEVKIYDSIWADYTAGVQISEITHSTQTLSSFRLKYGL